MPQIGIGQRVQVIDGGLTEYKQFGTVMAAGTSNSWFVQLDGDEQSDEQTFFQVEELQVVEPVISEADKGRVTMEEVVL